MKAVVASLLLIVLPATGSTQQPPLPLERYRKLEFPPKDENFEKGWQERVALEYDVINDADLGSLRAALKDADPFVRGIAARAIGIRADSASADTLADLVKADPHHLVRSRAMEALAYLKMKPEAIEQAKSDADFGVQWTAKVVAGQLKSDTDFAALVRKAYAAGIKREAMGSAKVGQPAPDFTAQTIDGKPFRLTVNLGKGPIALYFAAYDG